MNNGEVLFWEGLLWRNVVNVEINCRLSSFDGTSPFDTSETFGTSNPRILNVETDQPNWCRSVPPFLFFFLSFETNLLP